MVCLAMTTHRIDWSYDERCARSPREGAKEQREKRIGELAKAKEGRKGLEAETNGIHRGASDSIDGGGKWG